MKKNILIVYTCYGTGHYMATKAIEEYIKRYYPNYNIILLDPLSYSRPLLNKIVSKIGKILSTRLRIIKESFYKHQMYKKFSEQSPLFMFGINLFWSNKLKRKLKKINPYIIISTQVGATALIASHKNIINTKLISVFTDYGVHRMHTITHENVDIFCVPNNEIKDKLLSIGVKENKIKITGIPVRSQFLNNKVDKQEIIEKYKLIKNKPIFLFMCGGGLGLDNAFTYFIELLRLDYDFSYIFISGKNKDLYRKAKFVASMYKKQGIVLGYINEIDKLIKCSDLVFGKPGGIMTSETLNIGIPICAIEPITGQENYNALFIKNNNFGFYIKNKKSFKRFLRKIKRNKIDLQEYKKNIKNNFNKFKFIDIDKI